ncbi:1-deoxy-D-xylulose-5-phosphate reductoisomerase [Prosthecochloris sp. N3]|uniref:1-deoxy-D-xylulose 5-phosphate reductoisomerase n=1 Tax=Prosthecochloris ethylica TaxID=2743976 RepID=A0ABR9XT29_9CHLB|nr:MULTISPECIES: 1-deoxy-D-xylulose-5-phosphate reductoisomerase [Prosthecochloris]MEC9486864.1 1-deoxy-D-xylulose-5-phosphate reductoisomerase [Prosthecochloris sp.]MBF0585928.1 1-deoxy-D-xylulose-5-phosphate reductoisomerase [Prosthecochloris ethylica]MBF0637067.1 1-deoxy-D-xylulose-5-phosphate reductoisomerase [Prosthecochloris ethylica]NUK47304.1 1-deoxy-D-xylulose-5-phosphate reductoisomerase [Prosthecochloris ethylica]RNA65758.1 1-deoxy-D-xylulose-5-phosphate reductoisomerase [Prosthecoc
MKSLSILGSTGSIGLSTLDVVRRHPDRFSVAGLAEGHDVEALSRQIREFNPSIVSVRDEASAAQLRDMLDGNLPEICWGIDGAARVGEAEEADMVVSAIVGAAGLVPTVRAIKAGKDIALANKETLVVAGQLVSDLVRKHNVRLLPVDSEHSAIFQSLEGHRTEDIERIILTASGGPFRTTPAEELLRVGPEQALKHPQWDMGAKITIDSATLMNKGLEVIEAHWLFGMPADRIGVVVHPQSIIHSMVEYIDGCVMAQLGAPDMRAPIAYALSFPERCESGIQKLDLTKVATLTFEEPDTERFPSLRLAFDALRAGGTYPAVLNAANEIAVASFLDRQIGFTDIPAIVEKTMDAHKPENTVDLDHYLAVDRWARETAAAMTL